MTSFMLKIIAIFTMFCNHVGYAIKNDTLIIIGDIAFPIFAFLISEGYSHTKDWKKYLFRLIIFAIISQIPFYLFNKKFITLVGERVKLNIFFTLALGLLSIIIYDYFQKQKNSKLCFKILNKIEVKKILGFFAVALLSYIGYLLNVDYDYFGVLIIFSFYLFKNNKIKNMLVYILLCFIRYGSWMTNYGFHESYIYIFTLRVFAIVYILLYNGEEGKKAKWLFYSFYPIHLLLLYLIVKT